MNSSKYLDSAGLTYLWEKIQGKLDTKVDKVDGKGLSTNDYTTAEKNKLAGIAEGAEVNVLSDWNATTGDAVILNKPKIENQDTGLGIVFGTKINGLVSEFISLMGDIRISNNGNANIVLGRYDNDDDTITLTSRGSDGGIHINTDKPFTYNNKEVATTNQIPTTLSSLTDDTTHRLVTDTEKAAWNNKSNFSGSYNDLSNKPTIPTNYAGSPEAGGTANKTASIPYAQVDSTSTATAFTATVDGITELRDGVCCLLKNGVVTSASGFTLNVNNLGAKPCYTNLAAATRDTTIFNVNYTMLFVYDSTRVDGGGWICYRGYDSNSDSIGYNIREYNNGSKKLKTAMQRYQLVMTTMDDMLLPVYSGAYTTATTKVLTTESFNPFGQIYYYGVTTNVAAGGTVGGLTLYIQATVNSITDLRYSFNTGSTLTAGDDIYLVCVPQSDGSVKLHSSPIAKSLPTTEDGLVYKRLGKAYDTYRIILELNKPCYYYKDGAVRLWTNQPEVNLILNVTYSQLVTLRNNSKLVPGLQYRITDYVTTVVGYNTQSAGHAFDIIVTATDVNKLSEDAKAIQHEGDTYFSNSNLEAWELKYRLDNVQWSQKARTYIVDSKGYWFIFDSTTDVHGDTGYLLQPVDKVFIDDWGMEYALTYKLEIGYSIYEYYGDDVESEISTISQIYADAENGKGTITYMKDEYNNECSYDFKNIQFKRYKATDSVSGRGLNNMYIIADADPDHETPINLSVSNINDFIWAYTFSSDAMGGEQTDYSLDGTHSVYGNIIKEIGNGLLPNNVFLGLNCYSNILSQNCYYNSFSNNCRYNSFLQNCYNNSFSQNCYNNSFSQNCCGNSFSENCNNNSFLKNCNNNSFLKNCGSNSFSQNVQHVNLSSNYMHQVIVESGNQYLNVVCSQSTSSPKSCRNIKICQGYNNSSTVKTITVPVVNNEYLIEYKSANSVVYN